MKRKIYREDIIQAGFDLMYLNGYHHTGIKEITEKISIPKGSFYNHFKNKEEFGLEVLDYYSQSLSKVLVEKLRKSKLTPLNRLKDFFKSVIKEQNEIVKCKLGCLRGNFSQELGDTNETFRKAIDEDYVEAVAIFKMCLDEAKEVGEIDSSWDTNLLSNFMTDSWQGALTRMKSSSTTKPLQTFYDFMFGQVL